MALTSIQSPPTNTAVFYFNRGNGGVLTDISASAKNMLYIPIVTASGGETSYVF